MCGSSLSFLIKPRADNIHGDFSYILSDQRGSSGSWVWERKHGLPREVHKPDRKERLLGSILNLGIGQTSPRCLPLPSIPASRKLHPSRACSWNLTLKKWLLGCRGAREREGKLTPLPQLELRGIMGNNRNRATMEKWVPTSPHQVRTWLLMR